MSVSLTLRKGLLAVAALGALALGGSALADAATNGSSTNSGSSSSSSTTQPQQQSQQSQQQPPQGRPSDPTKPGGHRGANGQVEQALPSDVAAKVKAAAEAKVPGGTVERVETDVDHGSPYEAHIRKSDGTELEVLVNKDFTVTAVNTMQHP
jgi:hypothetical protein